MPGGVPLSAHGFASYWLQHNAPLRPGKCMHAQIKTDRGRQRDRQTASQPARRRQTGRQVDKQAVAIKTHPLMIIDQAAPVEHVHHGLEAEDWRCAQLVVVRNSEGLGSQLDGLVCLCPCKLLLPDLPHSTKLLTQRSHISQLSSSVKIVAKEFCLSTAPALKTIVCLSRQNCQWH